MHERRTLILLSELDRSWQPQAKLSNSLESSGSCLAPDALCAIRAPKRAVPATGTCSASATHHGPDRLPPTRCRRSSGSRARGRRGSRWATRRRLGRRGGAQVARRAPWCCPRCRSDRSWIVPIHRRQLASGVIPSRHGTKRTVMRDSRPNRPPRSVLTARTAWP